MAYPGMVHSFVAKATADVSPTQPGLEHTLPENRMHHTHVGRMHHTLPENRMHHTMADEDK